MRIRWLLLGFLIISLPALADLRLNDRGYFEAPGLNVIVFDDIYPEGHQTGVTVIQHGVRVAANGDLRLEASPGQWSPVPKAGTRTVDRESQSITQVMAYPDSDRDRKGFNPIIYPDLDLSYSVRVIPQKGTAFRIIVDLDQPLPEEWVGKVGFNFELFPGTLFGKAWLLDESSGHFTVQPNGPIVEVDGEQLATPLASGERLVVAPDDPMQRLQIEELPSERVLKYSVGKGFVEPIYLAAASKVLLAEIPFEDREKLLKVIEKKGLLRKSNFKKADLLKEVSLAKKKGYATSFGEIVPGASSIAVAVKGYVVPVAICIFGPMERFDLKKMEKVLPDLRRASRNITKNIEENLSKRFYD